MSGHAKTVATSVISQLAEATLGLEYSAAYRRMYVTVLEEMEPASSADSQMKLTLAPMDIEHEHAAWGGCDSVLSLGLLFEILVANAADDSEIDPLETFLDDVCEFLIGPRKYGTVWSCTSIKPILGDVYNDHLRSQSKFHVPCLLQFKRTVGVS